MPICCHLNAKTFIIAGYRFDYTGKGSAHSTSIVAAFSGKNFMRYFYDQESDFTKIFLCMDVLAIGYFMTHLSLTELKA